LLTNPFFSWHHREKNKSGLILIMKPINIIDYLPFAVMGHDKARRIFLFNKEAEKITGYKREEVIGRDCHDVFKGGFCGGKCAFREGVIVAKFDMIHYPLEFVDKNGKKHMLDVRVKLIFDDKRELSGVIATFDDVRAEIEFEKDIGKLEEFCGIVGKDEKMLRIYQQIKSIAKVSFPVLIYGESGTGKELIAEAIHKLSPRKNGPFVPVNCSAIPDTLIESELFGYEKGAFTGAIREKKGRFELAHGGTIFLDEIGDISPLMQVKLLRVIQTGMVERLGSTRPIRIDTRIISATNKDLEKEVREGKFRDDLFYRISVIPIKLSPLRERKGDIPLLVNRFLKDMSNSFSIKVSSVSKNAMNALIQYTWPGNVRELQNVIQYAVVQAQANEREHIDLSDFPEKILGHKTLRTARYTNNVSRRGLTLDMINEALKRAGGNKVKAARLLGISRATLYRLLQKNK